MRRFAFLLLLIVIVVGFFRGWFTVNRERIEEDERLAKEEVRELIEEAKEKRDERAKQDGRQK